MRNLFLTASAILAFNAMAATAAMAGESYSVKVDGMTCPFCVAKVEKTLKAMPGVASVSANLKAGLISVCATPPAQLTSDKVKSLITSAGFTFKKLSKNGAC